MTFSTNLLYCTQNEKEAHDRNLFRKQFCSKSFWDKDQATRDAAVKAIAFVYTNLATEVDIQKAADMLDMTLTEYTRREVMLLTLPKKS